MKFRTLTRSMIVLALLAGCAQKAPQAPPAPPAPPDSAAIEAELKATMERVLSAFGKMDSASVASFFTEDATWVLPNAATFKGRAEIEKGASAFFATFESVEFGAANIDKLVVVSDTEAVTFMVGSYTVTTKDNKTPKTYSNPYADYWQKGADGMWRIAYEVNAEGPLPAAPAQP
jgi:uncharacterized protein (TIGR02246 family)